jgi:hypothetical protein
MGPILGPVPRSLLSAWMVPVVRLAPQQAAAAAVPQLAPPICVTLWRWNRAVPAVRSSGRSLNREPLEGGTMHRSLPIKTLIGVTVVVLLLGGCSSSGYYVRRYRAAIAQNQLALQQLELGMSASAVRATMGSGGVIQYKKVHFVDPWRSESFQLNDGTDVLLLFYLTQPARGYSKPQDQDLTPIVLENNGVVGWGWSYIGRNTDRYGIASPREQR